MNRTHPLIDEIDVALPRLPADLEGVRIAQLSDLHIRRKTPRHDQARAAAVAANADLVLLTGDYIQHPGDEPHALAVLRHILEPLRPRHGIFGVFGNHDTPSLRRLFAELPVRWLDNEAVQPDGLPLLLAGVETDKYTEPDSIALLAAMDALDAQPHREALRVLLAHFPMYLPVAAHLRFDLMLSGHTHGGQIRLPRRTVLVNSSDLPGRLTSGILRLRDTLALVTRGLGESWLPLRVLCPPQLPVYRLTRGPMRGDPCTQMTNVLPW